MKVLENQPCDDISVYPHSVNTFNYSVCQHILGYKNANALFVSTQHQKHIVDIKIASNKNAQGCHS